MRAALLFAVCTVGCNAVWGIEAADGELPTTTDAGGDDPCAPSSGVAKVCVRFEAPPHPAYDVSSGAEALKLDGAGVITLFVFDEDPADPAVPFSSRSKFPLDGTELKVDAFPVTVPITTTPGRHWLIAQFEDNKAITRSGENSFPAGDYVTVPSRSSTGKLQYPLVDAVLEQAVRVTMPLQPLRRVNVDLQADATLRTTYSSFAVNGDGPVVYVLFDGAFADTTPFLEFVSVKCVNAAPMTATPPVLKSGFTTVVTGTHSIVASLEDYDSVSRFPTRGSLLTPSEGALPPVTVSPTAWTANTSLKFVKVLDPYKAGEKADEARCP